MTENTAVKVKLLERDIQLACPPDEVENLHAAAKHLDNHLRDLRKRSSSSTPEKLALVAAMNMTSQLLKARSGTPDLEALLGVLNGIESTVEQALTADTAAPSPELDGPADSDAIAAT